MWVFVYSWARKGGKQHVASCWGTEDRLEATSHPRVTPNSLNLPVSSPTFILAYQYLLHKRWRLFSPARVCGFITIIIPKHRLGTNLPRCTMSSFHIKAENKGKKIWLKCINIGLSTSIKVAWRLWQHKDNVNFPYRMPLNLLLYRSCFNVLLWAPG